MQNKHQVFHFNRHKSSKASMYITPTYLMLTCPHWMTNVTVSIEWQLYLNYSHVPLLSVHLLTNTICEIRTLRTALVLLRTPLYTPSALNLLKDDINVNLNPECQSCWTLAQSNCKELIFILQIIHLLKQSLPFNSSGSESGPVSGKGTGQMRTAILDGLI